MEKISYRQKADTLYDGKDHGKKFKENPCTWNIKV